MTLDSREDRRIKLEPEFDRLDIPIEWWIVERHPNGGNYGCFETHINIWEKNNADIMIVFEDDFNFAGSKKEFWKILNEAIQLSNKYDTVHLGVLPYQVKRKISDNFYEGKFLTASCYLSRKNNIQRLLPIIKQYYGCQPDVAISQISSQVGLLPCKIFQDFTDSNNGWTKNIPIISKYPNIEKNLRELLSEDPYYLLKFSPTVIEFSIKCMIGLNFIQHLLPKILYNTEIEFADRRI
jgi:hypothetical protein